MTTVEVVVASAAEAVGAATTAEVEAAEDVAAEDATVSVPAAETATT